MPKVDIVLDSTMTDTFQSCEVKFNYRFNFNKGSDITAPALDQGQLMHSGFEAYYKSLAGGNSFSARSIAMHEAIDIGSIESDLEQAKITNLHNVIQDNVQFWQVRDERLRIKQVETSFAYELYTDEVIRLIMIGKIDLMVDEGDYINLPYDHKSFSRNFPIRRLVNQFTNYSNAVRSNYLIVNRVGFQTSVPREQKYLRQTVNYDKEFIDQWKANMVKLAYRYLECEADNSWMMNLTSCDKYGRLCEYHDVCNASGMSTKEHKLNVNFKTLEPWDVSKSLGTGE